MNPLYRVVYASKNLLKGGDAEVKAEIERILAASRVNNARADVTGALMFNGGAFAQVLEGPRQGVEETFERIQRDARHGEVTVLECGPVSERGFRDWSMAFVGQSESGRALWGGLETGAPPDLTRLHADAVFGMLHSLVLEEEGAAPAPVRPAQASGPGPEALPPALDEARLREELARLRPAPAAEIFPAAEAFPAETFPAGTFPAEASPAEALAGQTLAPPPPAPPVFAPAPAESDRTPRGAAAALTVLRVALVDERGRTAALRAELDDLRVALAGRQDDLDALRAERDRWARRARLLAAALSDEAQALDAPRGAGDDAGGLGWASHPGEGGRRAAA